MGVDVDNDRGGRLVERLGGVAVDPPAHGTIAGRTTRDFQFNV
jgi:hypothetical protein